jgi:hypothetical protein
MQNLTATSSTSTLDQQRPLPESWVEKLFEKMLFDYGKKFTDQWGAADSDGLIAYWSASLAGFTGAELDRGVKAMEALDWPPTLPQFKKLCRPPMDPMVAFFEAQAGMLARAAGRMGEWSHRAVFWAAMQLGTAVTEQQYATIRPRWEKALGDALALGSWGDIPQPAIALPAPGRTRLAMSVAKERLSDLQASGILKTAPDPTRRLEWAHRIVEREAAGDRQVELHTLKVAMAALERG